METHSGILAWRIPWTEESGGLPAVGCKESDPTEKLTLSLSTFIRSWISLRNPFKVWLFLGKGAHTQDDFREFLGVLKHDDGLQGKTPWAKCPKGEVPHGSCFLL